MARCKHRRQGRFDQSLTGFSVIAVIRQAVLYGQALQCADGSADVRSEIDIRAVFEKGCVGAEHAGRNLIFPVRADQIDKIVDYIVGVGQGDKHFSGSDIDDHDMVQVIFVAEFSNQVSELFA